MLCEKRIAIFANVFARMSRCVPRFLYSQFRPAAQSHSALAMENPVVEHKRFHAVRGYADAEARRVAVTQREASGRGRPDRFQVCFGEVPGFPGRHWVGTFSLFLVHG